MVLYDDKAPGVYIEEVSSGARPIQAVSTSIAGFLGKAPNPTAHVLRPFAINNWTQFKKEFCPNEVDSSTDLARAVYGFFQNGGSRCYVVNLGEKPLRDGLSELERIDDVAIVAAPGYTKASDYDELITHCENLRDRVAILDAPKEVGDIDLLKVAKSGASTMPVFTVAAKDPQASMPVGVSVKIEKGNQLTMNGTGSPGDTVQVLDDKETELGKTKVRQNKEWELTIPLPMENKPISIAMTNDGGLKPPVSAYATFYFPWILARDPLLPRKPPDYIPPSGHIAGIWARSDASRGVHKAPANENIRGALGVRYRLTDVEQGGLNQVGVNCIRLFAREGIVVWGARTLATGGEWRYLNVRRLFNMIEESIEESTRWIVFEPNDETLWKAIRRDVTAFLTRIWRTGALMGSTADQAFFVKCDAETNPPEEIDAGKVTIVIGIAPVKPAEFVVFQISQQTAGAQVTESGG